MEHMIKPVVAAQYLDDITIYRLNPPGSFDIDTATGSEVGYAGSFEMPQQIISMLQLWRWHGQQVKCPPAYLCLP